MIYRSYTVSSGAFLNSTQSNPGIIETNLVAFVPKKDASGL